MARKTNNSNQSLTSVAARALTMSSNADHSQLKTFNKSNKKPPRTPKIITRQNTRRSSSSGDEADADIQADDDDGAEADSEEEEGEPAVIAPSVRPTIECSEQAGLLTEAVEGGADTSISSQSQGCNTTRGSKIELLRQSSQAADSDDDDYAAVNYISDSTEDEACIEELAEKDIIEEANADRASGVSLMYDIDDGVFGASDTFFDQCPEEHYTGSNILAGDETDFPSAYIGIPETPVVMQAPLSGRIPSPSPRRVRFKNQTSVHRLPDDSNISDIVPKEWSPEADLSINPREGDSDDGGSASGYETDDGGTTDEEEPPVSAQELIKAPHLLHRPSLSSLDTSPTSYVYTPSTSENLFKVPSVPASLRCKGPRLGTFKTSPSRSYAMLNQTGDTLLIRHATRPSPSSTPRHSRVGSVTSNSAPQTPVTSHATLATAPDLSETEFSDAAASQVSMDPVLSAGPDFVTSAGFSRTTSHVPQMAFPPLDLSSVFSPQDGFPMIPYLETRPSGSQADFGDQAEEDVDESAFEDMIVIPDDSSSDEQVSVVSASSPTSTAFHVETTSPSAQAAAKMSPSSSSSTPDINFFDGIGVTAWRNSTNQTSQQRQPSNRPPHGLSLHGNALKGPSPICPPASPPKKRKLSENHGIKPPPAPTGKRRLTASHG